MTLYETVWPNPFVFAAALLCAVAAAACVITALWSLVPVRYRTARRAREARGTQYLLRPASPVGPLPTSR